MQDELFLKHIVSMTDSTWYLNRLPSKSSPRSWSTSAPGPSWTRPLSSQLPRAAKVKTYTNVYTYTIYSLHVTNLPTVIFQRPVDGLRPWRGRQNPCGCRRPKQSRYSKKPPFPVFSFDIFFFERKTLSKINGLFRVLAATPKRWNWTRKISSFIGLSALSNQFSPNHESRLG